MNTAPHLALSGHNLTQHPAGGAIAQLPPGGSGLSMSTLQRLEAVSKPRLDPATR